MSGAERKRITIWAAAAIFFGPISALGSLLLFFGGSPRDPAWMWAAFFVFFYGGLVTGIAGLAALIAMAFVKVRD